MTQTGGHHADLMNVIFYITVQGCDTVDYS